MAPDMAIAVCNCWSMRQMENWYGSWHQTPDRDPSLQGVIVLDGLDVNQLHVQGSDGKAFSRQIIRLKKLA